MLMTFGICSCKNKQDETDYLDFVYEIVDDEYNTDYKSFNHNNTISSSPEKRVNIDMPQTKRICVNNKELNLKYIESLCYPIGNETFDLYLVDGTENKKVLLNSDGCVASILFSFENIDIQSAHAPEDIRPIIESKLKDFIDFSNYQNVNAPTSDNNQSTINELGIYDFLYYNSINGYMTDYTKFSVDGRGNVFGFSTNNLNTKDLDLNINKEREKELLTLKLKDIYNTDNTEYKSYNEVFSPQVLMYNNEICIKYFVSAKYVDSIRGELNDYIIQILIPSRLLTANSK